MKQDLKKKSKGVSLEYIPHSEVIRYKSKSSWLIVGIILTVAFFYGSLFLARTGWPIVIDYVTRYNLPKGLVYFVSLWGIHAIGYLTMGIVFYFIYSANLPFFEQYKINENPWPWNDDAEKWKILKGRSLYYIGMNNILIIPGTLLFSLYLNPNLQITIEVDKIPDMKRLVASIIFCMLTEDLGFWAIHKLLHVQPLYNWFHKVHHDHYTPFSVSTEH